MQNFNDKGYNTEEMTTLNDEQYRTDLNTHDDYSIIPQYLETEMNDFVSNFPNDSFATSESVSNFYNTNNSVNNNTATEYIPSTDGNNIIVLDTIVEETNSNIQERNGHLILPTYDADIELEPNSNEAAGTSYNYDNDNIFCYKNNQNMMENHDFMMVSSEEIINTADDILDLTTDEVEQIFDNNLISNHYFSDNNRPKDVPQQARGRINVVSNLMRSSPTRNMDASTDQSESSNFNFIDVNDVNVPESEEENPVVKRKSGRPKGARSS